MNRAIKKLLVFILLFSMVACSTNTSKETNNKDSEVKEEKYKKPVDDEKGNKEFDKYVDTLPKALLDDTEYGLNYYLVDKKKYGFDEDATYSFHVTTYEEYLKQEEEFQPYADKLDTFDVDSLSTNQKLTYDVLKDAFSDIDIPDEDYYYLTNNGLDVNYGIQGQFPLELYFYNFRNKQDIISYLNLLEEFPTYIKDLVKQEQLRQDKGFGMTKSEVDAVIEQADNFLDSEYDYLIDSFDEKVEGLEDLSKKEIKDFKKQNEDLLEDGLAAGYEDLADGLDKLDIKNTSELGYATYSSGAKYYESLIKNQVGFDDIESYRTYLNEKKTALEAEIKEMSKKELNSALMDEVDYTKAKNPEAVLDDLQKDMKKDFPKLNKDLDYSMEIVPEGMQDVFSAAAAYFTSPSDELDTKEKMVLNSEFDQSSFTTIAHEGYPGHMYQQQYYKQMVAHPFIRDILNYGGYTEGYANYVEQYSIAYANDPEAARNKQITEQYMYICILLSDIDIHYDGKGMADFRQRQIDMYKVLVGHYTSDDEIEEMLSESALQGQYDQLLQTPAIFPKYYAAGFRIADLREKYSKYSDKEFHEALLHVGPSPYHVMDEYIGEYLKANFE